MGLQNYLKDRHVATLLVIVLLLASADAYYGMHNGIHLGIEFAGGTEIPLTLAHGVNATEMASIVSVIEQRVSTFGLRQVDVEGIGNSTVYVTIPSVSGSEINKTISIIDSEGNFAGVAGGKEALNGSGILKGSVVPQTPQAVNNSVSWAVSFFLTDSAASHFAVAAFGESNKPLYLFLDRPTRAVILVNSSVLSAAGGSAGITHIPSSTVLSDMQAALTLGNSTIPVMAVYNTKYSVSSIESFLSKNSARYRTIIASSGINGTLISNIENGSYGNYTLKLESAANMTPTISTISANTSYINTWSAVGILSSPILNPGVTNGNISNSYQISGFAPQNLSKNQQSAFATNQSKTISSILTGGALPVAVIVGTPTVIPPTLGGDFLEVSAVALAASAIAISLFIFLRYKKLFLIAPIMLTTFFELFIIFSVIGLVGTIDLSAVAGMIAIVGTGVDAQIIITDEVLAGFGKHGTTRILLGNAFYIVWADAMLLVIAMVPLFFSTSLVQVIGFSESTIIGALLGVLITRPAYGAIIGKHYSE